MYDKLYEAKLFKLTEARLRLVEKIFNTASDDLTRLAWHYRQSRPMYRQSWFFARNRALKGQVDLTLKQIHSQIMEISKAGARDGWELANQKNDAIVKTYTQGLSVPPGLAKTMGRINYGALDMYAQRAVKGMDLSKRVWSYVNMSRAQLEQYLGSGVLTGKSAAAISRDVRQALKNPTALFRRVRDADGNLALSRPARAYNPGRGVYRSAYQNALRMVQTEVNMAFRACDFQRRQSLPMVLGQVVKLSSAHPEYDMCDPLAGEYPKGFYFSGWHPRCICYSTSKMMKKEDFKQYLKTGEFPKVPQVDTIPKSAEQWVKDNADRLKGEGSPYWIRDNFDNKLKYEGAA